MGGGLMQLVAYGAQDIYLTGNPQISFFKIVYRRHTNFSMETIQQTFNGPSTIPTTNTINKLTAIISREGDLIYKMYAVVDDDNSLINNGSQIIKEATIEIGGQMIDKHYQEWNEIWNELSTPESKAIGLKSMQGCIGVSGESGANMIQIPLNFWFCRNAGLALPLIALQYHEVKIHLDITNGGNTEDKTLKFFVDYIYLDTEERKRFAQNSHEYLIEQIQRQPISNSKSQTLVFNHPVKEIIWTNVRGNNYGSAKLKLNGQDRFSYQKRDYFQLRQPYDYHTSIPKQNLPFLASVLNDSSGEPIADLDVTHIEPTSAPSTTHMIRINAVDNKTILVGNDVTDLKKGDIIRIKITGNRNATGNIVDIKINNNILASAGLVFYGELKSDMSNNQIELISPLTNIHGDTIYSMTGTQDNNNNDDHILLSKIDNANESKTSKMTKQINVYSFSLKPEEHQPSGTCNFSRIDTAELNTKKKLMYIHLLYSQKNINHLELVISLELIMLN